MTKQFTSARVQITPQGFALFRDFLQDACGILLGDNKEYLVSSRLNSIMQDNDFKGLDQLVNQMKRTAHLKEQVVDAMTTNETLWFRDIHPYNILRDRLLPEVASTPGAQPLRIWSAACSSGQEPYSISMILDEVRRLKPGLIKAGEKVVATDISPTMLEHAKRGEYDMLAIGRGLQKNHLARYFSQQANGSWKINRDLQTRIDFKSLNLLGSYGALGKFDIVFCRNVLIYFSSELKQQILRKIHAQLKPGGYLFLGASESLGHLNDIYEMVHCSPGIIYRAK
ncbi:MAG: protein-glutamate O-methyltransferase CheR [Halopseudomonas sp.]